MASLDSANGPSATVRPFLLETILPSRSSGWPALHFPSCVSRSNQAYHWPTIFWISSGERPLSQCVPRNKSMYSFCVCVFIVAFLLLSCSFNDTTNEPATLGHLSCYCNPDQNRRTKTAKIESWSRFTSSRWSCPRAIGSRVYRQRRSFSDCAQLS